MRERAIKKGETKRESWRKRVIERGIFHGKGRERWRKRKVEGEFHKGREEREKRDSQGKEGEKEKENTNGATPLRKFC